MQMCPYLELFVFFALLIGAPFVVGRIAKQPPGRALQKMKLNSLARTRMTGKIGAMKINAMYLNAMNHKPASRSTLMPLVSVLLMLLCAATAFGEILPASRRITWQGNVGIPGGISVRTNIYQTITAGASISTIQAALNSCPTGRVVLLSPGTYSITGTLVIPSFVTLRGGGAGKTILNGAGSGEGMIRFGSSVQGEYVATAHDISSGYTKNSTSIVLNNTSGISVGTMLILDELNDSSLVSNSGTYGTINWNSRNSGARVLGQSVEVTGVSGNTVTFNPPMYWTYLSNLAPQAMSFNAGCQWGGLEDLTLKGNSTGFTAMFLMNGSKYCWVKGIENDYCDGDHGQIGYGSFRCEVRDSYFHDAYSHNSGATDSDLMIHSKSSANLVENNIFYRQHTSIMLNWGASGNVIGYNYSAGNFHSPATDFMIQDMSGNHGAHPMFNLWEGNIGNLFHEDSYWGSSSHNTYLRNWGMGDATIFPPYSGRGAWETGSAHHAAQALRAFIMDYQQKYGNWIGNVAGCDYAKDHDVRQVVSPQSRPYQSTVCLFALGYGDSSDSGSGGSPNLNAPVYTTLLSHGNYDTAGGVPVWQSDIADQQIPDTYYLPGKPAFFGTMPWPSINPLSPKTAATDITNLPAAFRFVVGKAPASGPVNLAPTVIASANKYLGQAPLTVIFSGSSSTDPEGTLLTFSWTFGDGKTSNTPNPTNTYTTPGVYPAKLTVSDGTNTSYSSNLNITVTAVGVNLAPIAIATASPTNGTPPLTVTFASVGSYDPEGAPITYGWTFGDGTSSTQASPSHTYQTDGSYVAQLTVSDGTNNVLAAPISINASSGLVAAYGFEEAAGTAVNDATQYANKGTMTSVARTAGKYGQGLDFNSTNAVVTISNSPSLQLANGMTLEAWVNPDSISGDRNIIYKDTWSYCLAGSSSEDPRPNLSGSFAPQGLFGTGSLPTNTWSHVAGTYDGTTLRLYVNGIEIGNQAQAGSMSVTAGALMIGGNSLVSGKVWTGLIDEVRIYNRALSAVEIQTDMAQAVVPGTGVNTPPAAPQGLRIVLQ